jgi:putative PIN family toxin of toxin-antitoxin system
MRIVLDTNVLLQIISARSPHHGLWQSLRQQKIILCVTTDILDEYHEIITQFYGSAVLAESILDAIMSLPNLVRVEKYYFWNIPYKDPDDQKFVDCCVACGADYLITEDKVFFKELKPNNPLKVKVIKPKNFLTIFNAVSDS